jgi:hypothetical protein
VDPWLRNLARQIYDSVGPNGRCILELLIDNLGERLSADHTAMPLNGGIPAASIESGRRGVAASLLVVGTSHRAT